MLPSPYGCRLGPRGYSFSRPQCVHFCYGPVTRSLPWGDFVDRLQSFSFHHLCYPNYGALTSTPAGLSPAEHASLRWTHNRTGRFPASGSRTRLHAFTHDTSCPSRLRRTSPKNSVRAERSLPTPAAGRDRWDHSVCAVDRFRPIVLRKLAAVRASVSSFPFC